jgi:hypothetical protein
MPANEPGLITVGDEIAQKLMQMEHGGIHVRDVLVHQIEDITGSSAWQVKLVLDSPTGRSWDVETTRALKTEARLQTDKILDAHGLLPEGITSILITAADAPERDVAPPDVPEPGERLDAKDDEAEDLA